jgi:hypothetical protein
VAEQVNRFALRRTLGLAAFAGASLIALGADRVLRIALHRTQVYSGFALLLVSIGLISFNARKKLPFLPLARASTWLQVHIYAGLTASVLFFVHLDGHVPAGALNVTLACLFVAVTVSGIFGLYLSRTLPERLTYCGESVVFERIPALRERLAREMSGLAEKALEAGSSSAIADFYRARLQDYFAGSRNRLSHVLRSTRPKARLLAQADAMRRYLGAEEEHLLGEVIELIELKDNLDAQLALQSVLKGWLFVHIPLSYALLLVAVVHGLVALAML